MVVDDLERMSFTCESSRSSHVPYAQASLLSDEEPSREHEEDRSGQLSASVSQSRCSQSLAFGRPALLAGLSIRRARLDRLLKVVRSARPR